MSEVEEAFDEFRSAKGGAVAQLESMEQAVRDARGAAGALRDLLRRLGIDRGLE